jgi:hypothetical protein
MQLVDSKQKMLTVGQILEIDTARAKQQVPIEMVKAIYAKMMTYPGAHALRYGNTAFVAMVSQKNPNAALVFTVNADVAPNVPINTMKLFDDLQSDGVTTARMSVDEPEIIAALQQLSQKYSIQMRQLKPDLYEATVALGATQMPGLAVGA